MRRLLLLLCLPFAACSQAGDSNPPEGCYGHGGLAHMNEDATNGHVPFACKDGTVGTVRM